jgi:hypothetical protein
MMTVWTTTITPWKRSTALRVITSLSQKKPRELEEYIDRLLAMARSLK